MANDILKNLNRSLEITLRDNIDGLKEFSLMMASVSVRPQYEILPVEVKQSPPSNLQSSAPQLTLFDTHSAKECSNSRNRKKRHA